MQATMMTTPLTLDRILDRRARQLAQVLIAAGLNLRERFAHWHTPQGHPGIAT